MNKYLLIIPFLLVTNLAFAQLEVKPNILSDKILSKAEQVEVKAYLKGKIFKEMQPEKNDYENNFNRGSVVFNSEKGVNYLGREVFVASNYSYFKVKIPDGTTLHNINFSQIKPHSDSIKGKYLHFKDCNGNNVEKHPTWTFDGGLWIHSRKVIVSDIDIGEGLRRVAVDHQVEKAGVFETVATKIRDFDAEKYDRLILKIAEQNK